MREFDEIIKKEYFFDHQRIEDTGDKVLSSLLYEIVYDVEKGRPFREIKRKIYKTSLEKDLKEEILKRIETQQAIILGEKKGFNLAKIGVAGFTFNEAIKGRKQTIKRNAVRFLSEAVSLNKANKKPSIEDEMRRYRKKRDMFWDTQTKEARNYAYEEKDREVVQKIKGWISIGILDRRTSPLCVRLYNKFYPIKEYKSRWDIPYLPPRHPKCRSIIMTVYEGEQRENYEGQDLNSFMRRNSDVAEDFLGKEKYVLWKKSKLSIKKFIDTKNPRLYTNEELRKKFDI